VQPTAVRVVAFDTSTPEKISRSRGIAAFPR
jgi:hypothetical protein